jgi:hypothetical protein
VDFIGILDGSLVQIDGCRSLDRAFEISVLPDPSSPTKHMY